MICNRRVEGCYNGHSIAVYDLRIIVFGWPSFFFFCLTGLSLDLTLNNKNIFLNFVVFTCLPPSPLFLFSKLHLSLLLLLLSHLASSMLLGWVESPGYPNGYLPHASLNWSRCARKGHSLSIRLIHLDLEDSQDCENDAVKVRGQDKL